MRNSKFSINKLDCSYVRNELVLSCRDLVFERGKIYFLLGKSGSGKSTFLEAVGLMNNTTSDNSEVLFREQNILEFWNKDTKELANFRASNYAFIFQSTNLMPGYSAGENMCFGSMINGKSLSEVKPHVLEAMENIELDQSIFDRNISHLSGGQRQRLAFVRAVTAEYEVLFGDEPTGNLDKIISRKLMDYLSEEIREKNKIAIIVSHNIDQAKKYADVIMCLKKGKSENETSELTPSTSFKKSKGSWYSVNDGKKVIDINNSLLKLLKGEYGQ